MEKRKSPTRFRNGRGEEKVVKEAKRERERMSALQNANWAAERERPGWIALQNARLAVETQQQRETRLKRMSTRQSERIASESAE